MKAIIVAAGTGSRLGELAKDTPKSLLDVNGQSILERQISVFKKLGISDITVIIGPHTEKFTFKNAYMSPQLQKVVINMRYVEKEIQLLLIKELKRKRQIPLNKEKTPRNLINYSKKLVDKYYKRNFDNKVTPIFN